MANCRMCGKMFHLSKRFKIHRFDKNEGILKGWSWKTYEVCEWCYDEFKVWYGGDPERIRFI